MDLMECLPYVVIFNLGQVELPLPWHLCRACDSRKLERAQERALRDINCERSSRCDKLLNMANLCTLRNRRLQDMAVLDMA